MAQNDQPGQLTGNGLESSGVLLAIAAYGLWGMFPLYFVALEPAGAFEILAHRVLWTMLVCLLVLAVRGQLNHLLVLVRRPRLGLGVGVAGVALAANWTIYVYAVLSGRASEAALGYFINPLVTVALGVLVLKERLRRLQWVAVGIGLLAVAVLTLEAGRLPLIALGLAFSFGTYGLIKKLVGVTLPPVQSLAGESLLVAPLAALLLLWLSQQNLTTWSGNGSVHVWLLVGSGVVTAAPLLLFAGAARRISLVALGFIQYLAPVLQLILAVTVLHESVSTARWIGFGIVWFALIVLTVDQVQQWRRRHPKSGPSVDGGQR